MVRVLADRRMAAGRPGTAAELLLAPVEMNEIETYARQVVAGSVAAGKYHRLACARHLRDLERQGARDFPYVFDLARAERFFAFAGLLKHYKGEWAGQPIVLGAHQKFRKGCKYGWVHRDTGLRRFRNSYEEI